MMTLRPLQIAALGGFVVLFGVVSPSFAQVGEPKLDLRRTPTKLKPGALPGPGSLPKLNIKKPLGKTKLDPKTLRKTGRADKAGLARRGVAKKGVAKGTSKGTAAPKFGRNQPRRPPPGITDNSKPKAEKALPGWRQSEEKEDDKPTLSADFIKNCARLKPGVKVHLDIYDEELEAVVKLIACMTGKNIILAKPLKGKKITIYSPTLVTANEAYKAFLTALEANGFTISKQGRFLRIIDIKEYAKHSDPFLPIDRMPAAEDRMVTQVINLENVDAQEMNEVITKLASPHAQIIVYQPTNSLIMTELSSNLRKIKGLLKELDVPGGQEQLWTYQILYADAPEIASKIQELFESEATGKSTARKRPRKTKRGRKKSRATAATSSSVGESELDARVSKIVADERTNRLFIVANARSYRRVKSLIAKLDIAVEGDGQVHIHQLNHAKAQDLSSVLSNLSQEQRSRGNTSKSKRRSSSRSKASKSASAGATSAALFEGEVSVTADEDTNALVITASLKDYLALKKVIDILDKPRRQVFIEAVIMEVSVTSTRQFGMSFHTGQEIGVGGEKVPFVFGNQFESVGSSFALDPSALTGMAAVAQSSTTVPISAGGTTIDLPVIGVLIKAMATSDDVNIMSSPHILTTDNEEAEIIVGQNVPFVTNSLGSGASALAGLGSTGSTGISPLALGGFLGNNIQRQDVALSLKITPRINAANFVTLEVDQTIEEIESNNETLGPTTSKRQIKSTVVVKDQHTVVIGGLQKSLYSRGRSGAPILSEIPILGYLFRASNKRRERRNLLLLLTPHVVEGPEDFKAIFERKIEEHREFLARFSRDGEKLSLGVDFGKKHGLLEAINKSVEAARDDQRVLEELRRQEERPPLPQETDGLPLEEPPVTTPKKERVPKTTAALDAAVREAMK